MEPGDQEALRTTRAPCEVHVHHSPHSHINEIHHVWPRGDGGPDIAANRITVCATGHNNIHDLLSAYRKANGYPGWSVAKRYGRQERALAELGWRRIQWQGMGGWPVEQSEVI